HQGGQQRHSITDECEKGVVQLLCQSPITTFFPSKVVPQSRGSTRRVRTVAYGAEAEPPTLEGSHRDSAWFSLLPLGTVISFSTPRDPTGAGTRCERLQCSGLLDGSSEDLGRVRLWTRNRHFVDLIRLELLEVILGCSPSIDVFSG